MLILLQCSFIPKFSISIKTKYENNNGSTENVSFFYVTLFVGGSVLRDFPDQGGWQMIGKADKVWHMLHAHLS